MVINVIKKLNYIFDAKSKIYIVFLLVLIVIGSFLEMLGVTIFYPFVELIMSESSMDRNEYISAFFEFFSVNDYSMKITTLAIAIIVFYIIKNIYLTVMQSRILTFNYETRMRISTRLLSSYMSEPYSFHLQKNSAELIRTLQTDCSQFMLLVNAVLQFIAEITICVAIGIYLFHTSHSITIIVGGLLATCVGAYYLVAKKKSLKIGQQNQIHNAKLVQWINQALGGIKEVKILEREDYFVSEYKLHYKKLIKGAKDNEMIATVPKYITETVTMVGLLGAIIFMIRVGESDISMFVPQLTAFALAAFKLLPAVGKINSYNTNILYSLPSLDAIYRDIKEVEDVIIKQKKSLETGQKRLNNKIKIENVSFKYQNSEKDILRNVSFEIPKGTTVAFIGSSGAGKTTLADIILGLLSPTTGAVKVDGWNINESMEEWHRMIGYIPQTIYLSDDTIIKNVAFGIDEKSIDMQAVEKALKKAQLFDFINSLPEGLNTFVGDRGVRLSGGQRQRIGIARALYHDPDVLVLDEATSALDNETEKAVMESIDALKGEKTMIIIAHRLSTIKNADIVLEVTGGNVKQKEVL